MNWYCRMVLIQHNTLLAEGGTRSKRDSKDTAMSTSYK